MESILDIIKKEISQDYYQQNYPNDGQRFVAWYMRNIHLLDQCQTKDAVTDGANDKQIEKGRKDGFVETIYGRKRFLPDINSRNATVRGYNERNAINAPLQGSAADIIKVAMINVYRCMKQMNLKSKMILQVHDELVFDVVPNEIEQLKELVTKQMESVIKLRVPLVAEAGVETTGKEPTQKQIANNYVQCIERLNKFN